MIKMQVLCDFCNQVIPEDENGNVKLHRTKVWDTRLIFPHLCERCALKIDNSLLEFKAEVVHERELAYRNKKLNDERREKLGTKG